MSTHRPSGPASAAQPPSASLPFDPSRVVHGFNFDEREDTIEDGRLPSIFETDDPEREGYSERVICTLGEDEQGIPPLMGRLQEWDEWQVEERTGTLVHVTKLDWARPGSDVRWEGTSRMCFEHGKKRQLWGEGSYTYNCDKYGWTIKQDVLAERSWEAVSPVVAQPSFAEVAAKTRSLPVGQSEVSAQAFATEAAVKTEQWPGLNGSLGKPQLRTSSMPGMAKWSSVVATPGPASFDSLNRSSADRPARLPHTATEPVTHRAHTTSIIAPTGSHATALEEQQTPVSGLITGAASLYASPVSSPQLTATIQAGESEAATEDEQQPQPQYDLESTDEAEVDVLSTSAQMELRLSSRPALWSMVADQRFRPPSNDPNIGDDSCTSEQHEIPIGTASVADTDAPHPSRETDATALPGKSLYSDAARNREAASGRVTGSQPSKWTARRAKGIAAPETVSRVRSEIDRKAKRKAAWEAEGL